MRAPAMPAASETVPASWLPIMPGQSTVVIEAAKIAGRSTDNVLGFVLFFPPYLMPGASEVSGSGGAVTSCTGIILYTVANSAIA